MQKKKKVMLIDDNEAYVRLIGKFVRHGGYEFSGIEHGDVAPANVRQEKPDVILLDVAMPGISGLEVLRALKSDPATAHIPVAILTSFSSDEIALEARENGADDFIVKSSINPGDLAVRIANLLKKHDKRLMRQTAVNAHHITKNDL